MACSFLQEKISCLSSAQVAVPSDHVRLLQHGVLYGLQCRHLLWCDLSWSAGRRPASPWAARGSLLWPLEHLLPSSFHLGVGTMALSHFFSLTPHCHAAFMSFIKYSFLEVQPPWLRDTAWAPAANAPVYVGFNHGIVFQTYVSYPVHLF